MLLDFRTTTRVYVTDAILLKCSKSFGFRLIFPVWNRRLRFRNYFMVVELHIYEPDELLNPCIYTCTAMAQRKPVIHT